MVKKIGSIIIMLTVLSLMLPLSPTHAEGGVTMQVAPQSSTVGQGTTFTVNVSVTNVTNLYSWEFGMYYLNTILNCTNIVEGPFLKKGGSTFFIPLIRNNYNSTHGWLLPGASLEGMLPGVNGSGTVATITFQAIGSGDTPLHFSTESVQTFLINSSQIYVQFTTVDGIVHVVGSHDLAVTAVSSPKTVVGQTFCDLIGVTTQNLGAQTETFNLTLYANTTVIDTIQNIVVGTGTSTTVTFTWDTTGFVKGNYSISAYAWPVPGETNTANNNRTGGWVVVAIMGDLTGGTPRLLDFVPDGLVDMSDVGTVAAFFLQPIPPAPANCDVSGPTRGVPDGIIDMMDIGAVASNFLATDP